MFNVSMELEENTNLTPREILPPPFIVPSIVWRKATVRLVTVVPVDTIHAKAFREDQVKVQCIDDKMFRIVQKYLKTNNAEFYTFPKPEERTIKVIIKELTTDISDEELSEELQSQGYEVTYNRRFIKEGRKLKTHMVTLVSSLANKAIFNLIFLFFMAIKVKQYHSNNPTQCYNCQRFSNSSLHCGYSPRCPNVPASILLKIVKKLKKSSRSVQTALTLTLLTISNALNS